MPKFITYQRPAPATRQKWKGGGRPGAPVGKAGTKAPKAAPEEGRLDLHLDLKLPRPGLPRN